MVSPSVLQCFDDCEDTDDGLWISNIFEVVYSVYLIVLLQNRANILGLFSHVILLTSKFMSLYVLGCRQRNRIRFLLPNPPWNWRSMSWFRYLLRNPPWRRGKLWNDSHSVIMHESIKSSQKKWFPRGFETLLRYEPKSCLENGSCWPL